MWKRHDSYEVSLLIHRTRKQMGGEDRNQWSEASRSILWLLCSWLLFSPHTHTHTHSTRPQTHLGWQRLNMLPPAQRNLHSSKLSSLQSHADSNDPEMLPFWNMQFKEKMSLRRRTNVSEWREESERESEKEMRVEGVCSESLVRREHRCSRTNWVSAWAMGGSASKLLLSAQAGGRLWEVKLAKMEPCGNPLSLTRHSLEGFSRQAGESYKKRPEVKGSTSAIIL